MAAVSLEKGCDSVPEWSAYFGAERDGCYRYWKLYEKAGKKHGVDPWLLLAQGEAESGFNTTICSPAGACGIAQFVLGTARSHKVDRFDPESAIDGQAQFMAHLIKRFGSEELALAAYNSGEGRIAKLRRVPRIKETIDYTTRVLQRRNGMKQ